MKRGGSKLLCFHYPLHDFVIHISYLFGIQEVSQDTKMPNSLNLLQIFLQISILILLLEVLSSSSSSSTCDVHERDVILSFRKFKPSDCKDGGSLSCMGAMTPGEGYLNLTTASTSSTESYMSCGRVLYHVPVQIWPASFCASFSFKIFPQFNPLNLSGDGMTFVMAQDYKFDPNQQSAGGQLGLFDPNTEGNTKFQQVAIEMDTFMNEGDPDDNHIAIVAQNPTKPLITKSLNSSHIDLKSAKQIRMKIMYDGWTNLLQIDVGYEGKPLTSFLNYSIDVSRKLPKHVYIGFTASTGLVTETHQILDWVFSSTILPYNSLKEKRRKKIILESVLPMLGCLVLFVMIGVRIFRRRMKRKRERARRMVELERQYAAAAATPRKFTYKQLAKATKNFSEDNLLGSGGFGSVYKGQIVDPPKTIAVKKISDNSQQGEREYLAEICTIGRLRHKNILQLQGWSHENEQLLLVYDFMANRSLNGFIAGKNFLDWKTRCKILTGLASAMLYLQEECGDPVVHRDIKPSNIMLDEEFNPYLGDFGLARLLKNTRGVTTNLAGTVGYMAPELIYTGKATPESDVYSYGILALEVVTGKGVNNLVREDCSLVNYAWDMHAKGCLIECVDHKLGENFDKDQATRFLNVALACLDFDSNMRPKMRKVLGILSNSDEPLIKLPECRPRGVYVPLHGTSSTTHSTSSPPITLTDYPSCSTNSNVQDQSLVH